MSFAKRRIDVTFSLKKGQFTGTSSNTVTITGLRVSTTIIKAGGAGMSHITARIYGLSPALMNQLSTFNAPVDYATGAEIQVLAGDEGGVMSVIATGTIKQGWADYSQMPEVAFNVDCYEGYIAAIEAVPPLSYPGAVDAAQVMATLAKTMGLAFENNGVSFQLASPYFPGTARTQAYECAAAGDFNVIIDNGTLAIWPSDGYRAGEAILISPETGLVGYPTFMAYGVVIKCLLIPTIRYGALIQVQSSLPQACGKWGVVKIVYELQSETPDGDWFMHIEALSTNFVEMANGRE